MTASGDRHDHEGAHSWQDRFQGLLQELFREHTLQLEALREECQNLRARLNLDIDNPACVGSAPPPPGAADGSAAAASASGSRSGPRSSKAKVASQDLPNGTIISFCSAPQRISGVSSDRLSYAVQEGSGKASGDADVVDLDSMSICIVTEPASPAPKPRPSHGSRSSRGSGASSRSSAVAKSNGKQSAHDSDSEADVTSERSVPKEAPASNKSVFGREHRCASSMGHVFELKTAWSKKKATTDWGRDMDEYMQVAGVVRRHSKAQQPPASMARRLAVFAQQPGQGRESGVPCGCPLISPNSTFRMAWDLAGLFLISYDVISIPMQQAFQPDPHFITQVMDWVTLVFWTGDMIQGFLVGYFHEGVLVMCAKRIAAKYMRTWFLVDVVVVVPDWLMTLSPGGGEGGAFANLGRILRGFRAIRVLRLLRLLKLQRIINIVYDSIENESTFLLVGLAKLMVFVLVLNHVIACLWYLIGRIYMANGVRNWIEVGNIQTDTLGYRYTTSLHWSLTQFTPASMDVSARNMGERIFSIVVLFFAMVAFSSVVASITGSMTSIRNMKGDEMKQFWLLRRYLRQRNAPKDLSQRIVKYLEHQSQSQTSLVQASSIKMLSKLSEPLTNELSYVMHSPVFEKHPFFKYLCDEMRVVMHRMCRYALKVQSLAADDVVFNAGDEGKLLYFIKTGYYSYGAVGAEELLPPPQTLEWVAEPVLWTVWRHRGVLLVCSPGDLVSIDPAQFTEVMSLHPRPYFFAKRYGARLVENLNQLDPSRILDIMRTDDKLGEGPRCMRTLEIGDASPESGMSRFDTSDDITDV